jgi:hypothetical protein
LFFGKVNLCLVDGVKLAKRKESKNKQYDDYLVVCYWRKLEACSCDTQILCVILYNIIKKNIVLNLN